ncbi:hypothetical protein CDAR_497531 [Caerostris darwini]|uniref:Uncharacterized protein n=1 Tax=Caerostris darwini TaxID=1538125 RepID=A0AAV4S541_9ARAC|nr:hypothetical protein CDAR_497531 [Caerostris darwini]
MRVVSQPNAIIRLNGRIKESVSRIARRTSRYSERPSAVHSDVYIKSQISFSRGLRKKRRVTSDSVGIRCQFDYCSSETTVEDDTTENDPFSGMQGGGGGGD